MRMIIETEKQYNITKPKTFRDLEIGEVFRFSKKDLTIRIKTSTDSMIFNTHDGNISKGPWAHRRVESEELSTELEEINAKIVILK